MRGAGWLLSILLATAGCDCSSEVSGGVRDGGRRRDTGPMPELDSGPRPDVGPIPDAGGCEAPDMLIVLDHTMSMHRTPMGMTPSNDAAGHAMSKWGIAVPAIETLVNELDTTIRFGLERFPRLPGEDVCVTLMQRISGTQATNPNCEEGQIVVSPMLDASAMIDAALDVETTELCRSTPIAAALTTAGTELARIRDPIREQFVLLISDGQDSCMGEDGSAVPVAQQLARDGVHTFVVAFDATDGGVDVPTLNSLACAGRTATGFPAPCTMDAMGNYTATTPDGPPLFLVAEDATSLTDAMEMVAGDICCDCII